MEKLAGVLCSASFGHGNLENKRLPNKLLEFHGFLIFADLVFPYGFLSTTKNEFMMAGKKLAALLCSAGVWLRKVEKQRFC